jgi:division protein CdvB (Snf7/Vps24/ESCRT-III family)
MCFSNLPVEFNEDGDPYLADEADDVTHPDEDDQVGAIADECGCAPEADATIDTAPEEAYDAILAAVPETARSDLTETSEIDSNTDDHRGRDAAEGD